MLLEKKIGILKHAVFMLAVIGVIVVYADVFLDNTDTDFNAGSFDNMEIFSFAVKNGSK